MVNEEPPADAGSGMDFNTGQETPNMGKQAGWKLEFMAPEKMRNTVQPQGM